MPFTNPAIFFRTITTTAVITPDPSNLPAAQKLEFPSSGDTIVEVVQNTYQSNVSMDPGTNADGVKIVFVQDNGRLEDIVVVSGKIASTDTTFTNKMKSFSRKLQIEATFHKRGIFGFTYPVTSSFDFDPTSTTGYIIDSLQLTTRGQDKSNVDFVLKFKTGGVLT